MNLLKTLKKRMSVGSVGASSSSTRNALRPSPALQAAFDIVSEKLADNAKVIGYEFDRLRRLPESEWNPQELSAAAANPSLNRYMNVVPFDQNRVVLTGTPVEYINASLLTSKQGSIPAWSYIATQGPLARTSSHFWQMVLQQRSTVIVMLTRVSEKQVEKCWQYFPMNLDEVMEYGAGQQTITVRVVAMKDLDSDICMRELKVTDSLTESELQVFHYHYHRCFKLMHLRHAYALFPWPTPLCEQACTVASVLLGKACASREIPHAYHFRPECIARATYICPW